MAAVAGAALRHERAETAAHALAGTAEDRRAGGVGARLVRGSNRTELLVGTDTTVGGGGTPDRVEPTLELEVYSRLAFMLL